MNTVNDEGKRLLWSPIGPQLIEKIGPPRSIRLLIAPFMQQQSLAKLLSLGDANKELKVITRWNAIDIASGVSDPEVYQVLTNEKIPLFIHDRIHLKLIILDDGSCFVSSANLTDRGLGFCDRPNCEAGVWSRLAIGDWIELYQIIDESTNVDDNMYTAAIKYRDNYLLKSPPLPKLEFPIFRDKDFTLASLPASNSPKDLYDFCYLNDSKESCDNPRLIHDLVLYEINKSTPKERFFSILGERFRDHPFIKALVGHIREHGKMGFGETTAWIHNKCEDVPVPYRWEVKASTHILYTWLSYFFEEIEWSVPGEKSQVISWKEAVQ